MKNESISGVGHSWTEMTLPFSIFPFLLGFTPHDKAMCCVSEHSKLCSPAGNRPSTYRHDPPPKMHSAPLDTDKTVTPFSRKQMGKHEHEDNERFIQMIYKYIHRITALCSPGGPFLQLEMFTQWNGSVSVGIPSECVAQKKRRPHVFKLTSWVKSRHGLHGSQKPKYSWVCTRKQRLPVLISLLWCPPPLPPPPPPPSSAASPPPPAAAVHCLG